MTIKDFNDQLDIVRVVSDCMDISKSGKDYRGLCPFHGDTKNPSLSIQVDKGRYKCFACHKNGDAFQFYMEYHKLTVPEAMQELSEKYDIKYDVSPQEDRNKKYYSCMEDTAEFYKDRLWENRERIRYLTEDRKLTPDTISAFRLGYAPNKWDSLYKYLKGKGHSLEVMLKLGLVKQNDNGVWDFFRNRIMIPIFKFGTVKVIAFGGRLLEKKSDRDAKYMNSSESPIFSKRKNLYSHPGVTKNIRSKQQSMLLEGYFDVITAFQHGMDISVAGLGTAFTQEQASLLMKNSPNIIICFDNDDPGREAAAKAVMTITNEDGACRVVKLQGGKDIDEILAKENGKEEFMGYLRKSMFGIPYLVEQRFGEETKDYATIRSKLSECKEIYKSLKGIHQEDFLKELKVLSGYQVSTLKEEFEKITLEEQKRNARDMKKKKIELDNAKDITLELLRGLNTSYFIIDSYETLINQSSDLEPLRDIYKEIKKLLD